MSELQAALRRWRSAHGMHPISGGDPAGVLGLLLELEAMRAERTERLQAFEALAQTALHLDGSPEGFDAWLRTAMALLRAFKQPSAVDAAPYPVIATWPLAAAANAQ